MIKTQSGRISKTQLLHMISVAMQSFNVAFFVALGTTPEAALIISTVLGAAQSFMGMYLRTITDESMQ